MTVSNDVSPSPKGGGRGEAGSATSKSATGSGTVCQHTSFQHHLYRLSEEEAEAVFV